MSCASRRAAPTFSRIAGASTDPAARGGRVRGRERLQRRPHEGAPRSGRRSVDAGRLQDARTAIGLTPPYGHGGNYIDLHDVVELHRAAGTPAGSTLTVGTAEPWLVGFDASDDGAIVTFLQTLTMAFAR